MMAHVWLQCNPREGGDEGGEWTRFPVESGQTFTFPSGQTSGPGETDAGIAFRQDAQRDWVLITRPETAVRVNGLPVPGARVLADRDELSLDGRRAYFSTERPARIEPFPGLPKVTHCPRCKTEIVAGTPAVCCPGCSVWYHEDVDEELGCWTYGTQCMLCGHPTALEGGWRWTPEAL